LSALGPLVAHIEIPAHGDRYNDSRNGAILHQLAAMLGHIVDGLLDLERKFVGLQFFPRDSSGHNETSAGVNRDSSYVNTTGGSV
jgi:hypothetical protein